MSTLTVQFYGLCLFVPDPDQGIVHVLMPAAGVPGGLQGIPAHFARLYADEGYLSLGSPVAGRLVEVADLTRKHLRVDMPGALDYSLPATLANLRDVTGEPLVPAALGPDPGAYLTARVGLASGAGTLPANPVCWRFPPTTPRRPLTSTVVWTIPDDPAVPDAEIRLVVEEFGTGAARETVLFPIDGKVEVWVYHTDTNLLPGGAGSPPMRPGQPASHFAAYYILFDPAVANGAVPIADPCDTTNRGDGDRYGAIPYTCMGPAQSTAG